MGQKSAYRKFHRIGSIRRSPGIAGSGGIGVPPLISRLDVLVRAEEVVRVIFCLDGREAVEILAIGRADAIFALIHHEIHITPAAE
jgi:predicted ferric reductase